VILWIGLVLFASTNVDDIFVLLAFFADPAFTTRQVVAGQYLGMCVLIGLSLLGALGSRAIPLGYVGLLGFVPLLLGAKRLLDLRKPDADEPRADRFAASRPLAVAAVTVANGADNLGAYVPLFSTRRPEEIAVLCAVFLVLTGIWCLVAHRLVRHPRAGAPIRRYGRVVVPFALMGLGAYLLWPLRAFL
jgi:cadmium resistance protein CadD (predicted permease)